MGRAVIECAEGDRGGFRHRGLLGRIGAMLLLLPAAAWAGLGPEVDGFAAKTLAMGSADVAITDDAVSVNVNPAGLTRTASQHLDLLITPYYSGVRHRDEFDNDHSSDDRWGTVMGAAYARHLRSLPGVTAGLGLFAVGGSGFTYNTVNTAFGTQDSLSTVIGVLKAVAGLGWQVDPQLSVGAAFGISYASGREKFFPETSDKSSGFFGYRFDGGRALAPNYQLGVQYRPIADLSLGISYTSKTSLPLRHGSLTVDYDALGLGHVKYANAQMIGLAFAQDVRLGLGWRPRQGPLLLAFEVRWMDWSGALRSNTLIAATPDSAAAPQTIQASAPLDWSDQYVIAGGVAYTLPGATTLRAGFTLERDPVPPSTLNPLFNLIQRHEIDAGLGRPLGRHWDLNVSLQYLLPTYVTYTNPSAPFGQNAQEKFQSTIVTVGFSRHW